MISGPPGERRGASRGLLQSPPCHVRCAIAGARVRRTNAAIGPRSAPAPASGRIVIASANVAATASPGNRSAWCSTPESLPAAEHACASTAAWASGSRACAAGCCPSARVSSWLSGTPEWLGPSSVARCDCWASLSACRLAKTLPPLRGRSGRFQSACHKAHFTRWPRQVILGDIQKSRKITTPMSPTPLQPQFDHHAMAGGGAPRHRAHLPVCRPASLPPFGRQ